MKLNSTTRTLSLAVLLYATLIALTIAALLLLVGCGGLPVRRAQAGDSNAKRVERLVYYAGESAWKRSPYWRIDDMPRWPRLLVLANDLTACAVFDSAVYEPQRGDFYACSTKWRIARSAR